MALRVLAAAALGGGALVLTPYGPVSELLQKNKEQAWFGDHSEAIFTDLARVQKFSTPGLKECEAAVQRTYQLEFGPYFDPASPNWNSWSPWAEQDLDAIHDCEKFPCNFKLNQAEVSQVSAVKEEKRKDKLLELVKARIQAYRKTQRRMEYEFPGDPLDPWKWFGDSGFKAKIPISDTPSFVSRKLNLAPGKMRAIRQILDVRRATSADEATVWIRDAYTAHYFDGWGEWHHAACDTKTFQVTVVQSLFLEVDLYKKKDVFSRLSKGRLKSGIEEYGRRYLDGIYSKILK